MVRLLLLSCLLASCAAPPPPVATVPVAPDAAAEPAPRAAPIDCDLRPQFLAFGLPPRHQGHRPTCSICTTVAAFEFAFASATGRGERLSAEYLNWAANAATGRTDDGDFFHCALAGYERFGLCSEALLPYRERFAADLVPPPDALVDGGARLAAGRQSLQVRWLRPNDGSRGLNPDQLTAVLAALQAGVPVAVGAAHSRLLVGYRPGTGSDDGVFLTLDSGSGSFAEVPRDYVVREICDAFVVAVRGG
jgi:hypothetical protein